MSDASTMQMVFLAARCFCLRLKSAEIPSPKSPFELLSLIYCCLFYFYISVSLIFIFWQWKCQKWLCVILLRIHQSMWSRFRSTLSLTIAFGTAFISKAIYCTMQLFINIFMPVFVSKACRKLQWSKVGTFTRALQTQVWQMLPGILRNYLVSLTA